MSAIASRGASYMDDQSFFTRMAMFIALLVVFAFAQFSLRGMVDWRAAPWTTHAHGVAMLAWLAVFVAQNRLAERGQLARHRTLGRMAALLAVAIVVLGCIAGFSALTRGTQPPFFSPAFFLALTQLEALGFGGFVLAALLRRRDTEWHRRLMFGGLVLITEPAFGRLLPMPFLGGWGGWLEVACQLGLMAALALHDRRVLGRVHPATLWSAAIVVGIHALVELAAVTPQVMALAARIAGTA
jgi:hypothetical protein